MSRTSGLWKDLKRKKSKSDKHGGYYLTVSLPGGHKKVHHLVWEVFKGPRRKGYVINHKDGDRENCSLDNLEEITQKKNIENLIDRGNFKLFGKKYDRAERMEGYDTAGAESEIGRERPRVPCEVAC